MKLEPLHCHGDRGRLLYLLHYRNIWGQKIGGVFEPSLQGAIKFAGGLLRKIPERDAE